MKRVVSLLLAMVLAISLLPVSASAEMIDGMKTPVVDAAYNEALRAEVERQLDAYADTIDMKDAGDEAISALIEYAADGTGRNLWAGSDHPITAALLNTEMFNYGLSVALAAHLPGGADNIHLKGQNSWYTSKKPMYTYRLNGAQQSTVSKNYTDSLNDYDNAMKLITGGSSTQVYATRVASNAKTTTWRLYLCVYDTFDFNNSKAYEHWTVSASPEKLLSILGKLLELGNVVEPFSWYSYAFTQVTVPNDLLEPVEGDRDITSPVASSFDAKTAISRYADSVTPANAAEGAIDQIITHGAVGQGKAMTIKAGDPVMGSILSSNLFLDAFTRIFDGYLKSGEDSYTFTGVLGYGRQTQYFISPVGELGFVKDHKNECRYAGNTYDIALSIAGEVDFTLTFTKDTDFFGRTIYKADISVSDYFDKNDEKLKAIVVGVGSDPAVLKQLTSYAWSGSTSFTMNHYA